MAEFLIRDPGNKDLLPTFSAVLPLRATVLTCLTDLEGVGEFWCARLSEPVKYHFDASFDRTRCQPEFLDVDSRGEFLWVAVIVVWPTNANQHLHANMRGIGVQVGYVVDQTLGGDQFFDVGKIEMVGAAVADDVPQTTQPDAVAPVPRSELDATEIPPPADQYSREAPTEGDEQPAPALTEEQAFRYQVGRYQSVLATLTGMHAGPDLPQEARHDPGPNPTRPTYVIYGGVLRYYRRDRINGWEWVTANSLDTLLQWLVLDTLEALAWRWSANAPAAAAGQQAREAVAADFRRTMLLAIGMDDDPAARHPGSPLRATAESAKN